MSVSTDASMNLSKKDKHRIRFGLVTRWDIVVLCVLGILSGIVLFYVHPFKSKATRVWISEGGETIGYYNLNENREIRIKGPLGVSIVRIHDGKAEIVKAPCPNKTCMKMGPIPDRGRVMICIPNRLVVEIKDAAGGKTDAITR